jgi:hypothetical protein
MAITLQTTTGTQADVNAALGLPSDPTPASEPTIVTTATADSVPKAPAAPVAEPPVTPAPETPVVESDDDPEADASPQQQGAHTRNRLQKRINELVKNKYTTQGQLDSANAEIARLRQQQGPLGVTSAPAPPAASVPATAGYKALVEQCKADPAYPKDEDFDNYEDARAAQAAFISDRRVESRLAVEHQRTAQAQQIESGRQAVTAFAQRVDTFKTAHPDYDEVVVGSTLEINDAMKATIFNPANDGPAIAYYLGQHPEECARIAKLSPGEAWEEMGAIKAGLKVAAPAVDVPAPRLVPPVTKAPAPPQTVRGAVAPTSESLSDLAKKVTPGSPQTSEWIKRRNAELASRR